MFIGREERSSDVIPDEPTSYLIDCVTFLHGRLPSILGLFKVMPIFFSNPRLCPAVKSVRVCTHVWQGTMTHGRCLRLNQIYCTCALQTTGMGVIVRCEQDRQEGYNSIGRYVLLLSSLRLINPRFFHSSFSISPLP